MTTNHPDPTPPPAEPAPSLRPVEEIRDIHGSSGCKPILRGDELGDFYECCCGWRSDAGTGVGIARTRLAAADRENAELRGLLSRVARSAVRYDQRVYRLTDDFAALAPFLSEDDIAAAGERPSETDARVETERDDLRAQLAAAQAQLAEARAWVAKTEPYPDLNGNKLGGLRAALSAASQPEADDVIEARFQQARREAHERYDDEPPASDEPARCEHGEIEAHPHDDGKPPFVMKRCPGPAASGTPDGGQR